MQSLRIGSLELSTEGHNVRARIQSPDNDAVLDPAQLRQLILFAQQALQSELNQRTAHRVNVRHIKDLQVHLHVLDQRISAHACDLSLTGIQATLPADSRHRPLSIQESLQVELQHGQHTVKLPARVVRQAGATYGMHFTDCTPSGRAQPPAALQKILKLVASASH